MSAKVRQIAVETPSQSYFVEIAPGLLDDGVRLAKFAARGRLIIIADETVWGIHGSKLSSSLDPHGILAIPLLVRAGEQSKSWPELQKLTDALLAADVERNEHLVAFGGGVVGDLAGFAASILKRGCHYIQVPTTLLAQVDSSVGGKTGINTSAGKNLIGAFHQPSAVLIDTNLLSTLTLRHWRNGWAEIVKYGLIGNPYFFAWCEQHGSAVLNGEKDALLHAIATSVAMKAGIVAQDEQERCGARALLNLGHTFGHALEAETDFSDRLLHGEAVSLGLVLACELSAALGHFSQEDASRVTRHLKKMGLPTSFADAAICAPGERLLAHMAKDKKVENGTLPLILLRGIGEAYIERQLPLESVKCFLESKLG